MPLDPSADLLSEVRFLIGDAEDTPVLNDNEVQFALTASSDNTYAAAAICARALSARYARRVDSRFETIENKYSQLRDSYEKLARQLSAEAKKRGGLGLPVAGGIGKAAVETAQADTDRVPPFFHDNMFANPPASNE